MLLFDSLIYASCWWFFYWVIIAQINEVSVLWFIILAALAAKISIAINWFFRYFLSVFSLEFTFTRLIHRIFSGCRSLWRIIIITKCSYDFISWFFADILSFLTILIALVVIAWYCKSSALDISFTFTCRIVLVAVLECNFRRWILLMGLRNLERRRFLITSTSLVWFVLGKRWSFILVLTLVFVDLILT